LVFENFIKGSDAEAPVPIQIPPIAG